MIMNNELSEIETILADHKWKKPPKPPTAIPKAINLPLHKRSATHTENPSQQGSQTLRNFFVTPKKENPESFTSRTAGNSPSFTSPVSSNASSSERSPVLSPRSQRQLQLKRLAVPYKVLSESLKKLARERSNSDDFRVPVFPKAPFGEHRARLDPEFVNVPSQMAGSFDGEYEVNKIKKLHGRLEFTTSRSHNSPNFSPDRLPSIKIRRGSECVKYNNSIY
ncbi:unnamed protein product [Blepharisma stoltei]|uniref:TPX2 central domain-containing protein n=1 Tax=Blepharisma stoltei TaxID=1481888 RepID=A0AAU9IQM5_9CILI|nr:unnamed protein product [Blepharisma stoltei]